MTATNIVDAPSEEAHRPLGGKLANHLGLAASAGILIAVAASAASSSKITGLSVTLAGVLATAAVKLNGRRTLGLAESEFEDSQCRSPVVEAEIDHGFYRCVGQRIVKYDNHLVARINILGVFNHSIMSDPSLISESLGLLAVSLLMAGLTMEYSSYTELSRITHLASRLEGFVKYVGGFNTFFLGLYTSTSIARWWRLRTEGVGSMWASACKLSALLAAELAASDGVSLDELVDRNTQRHRDGGYARQISPDATFPKMGTCIGDAADAGKIVANVQRYARVSLRLIFCQKGRGQSMEKALEELESLGHLEPGEMELLRNVGANLAEAIWSWTLALLMKLYKAKRIGQPDGIPWWQYVDYWQSGRAGAALIGSQLGTQLPFQYVHFISVVVKISNLQFSVTMGILLGIAFRTMESVDMFIASMSAILIPMINNAVLVLNCGLENPFGIDMVDFPESKYLKDIRSDSFSYIKAARNLPPWSSEDWS